MLNGTSARRSFTTTHARTSTTLLAESLPGAVNYSGQVIQAGDDASPKVSSELQAATLEGQQQLTVSEVARVVAAERRRVITSLYRRSPSKEYAEDACGEAIQRLFRRLLHDRLRFSSAKAVIGWLHVSAGFVLREGYRSTDALDHTKKRDERMTDTGQPSVEGELPAAAASSIEDRLAAKQQLSLLAGLSPVDCQLLQEAAEGDRAEPASDRYRRRVCRARQRARRLIGKAEGSMTIRRELNARRTANRDR